MLLDFHIKSKLPLRRLHKVSAQCWRGRRRNVFLENFYAFRMTYFQIKVNNSGRCHNVVRGRILEVIFRDNRLFFMLFAYFVYIAHLTKIHTWKLFAHGKIFETRNFPYTHISPEKTKSRERCGKISAQPHTTLCIQFLDRENNDKNNTLPSGKQICFTIVWGCAEILPARALA